MQIPDRAVRRMTSRAGRRSGSGARVRRTGGGRGRIRTRCRGARRRVAARRSYTGAKARSDAVVTVDLIDVFGPAVFLDAGRFPHRRAINFFALDSRHVNARFGAGGKNGPRCRNGFGRRRGRAGRAAAVSRKNDIGEAAAAAIEDNVFDFADVLAPRILNFGADDAATLNVAGARGG